PPQMETFRKAMNIRPGEEWSPFEGLEHSAAEIQAFLDRVPFASASGRSLQAERIPVPDALAVTIQPQMSTQLGFGALLNELGRNVTPLSERIVTASPDVTVSTSLGPWVNRRACLPARLWLTRSRASVSLPPSTGSSRRRASTSNWVSPR